MIPKFKAWTGDKLLDVHQIDYLNQSVALLDEDGLPAGEYKFADVEIVQYIGLKDSKGVEMYDQHRVRIGNDVDNFIGTITYCLDYDLPSFDVDWRDIPSDWYFESHTLQTATILEDLFIEVIGFALDNEED